MAVRSICEAGKAVSPEDNGSLENPKLIKSKKRFWTQIVSLTDCESIRKYWLDLARQAIEPNPFYEPDYLTALAKHVRVKEQHFLVLVWANNCLNELVGLFPITRKGLKNGFPVAVTCCSFDSFIGVCTPLISPCAPEEIWGCFFKAVKAHPKFPDIIYIPEFYINGATGQALKTHINAAKVIKHSIKEFERAIALPHTDYKTYSDAWSKKKARNIRSREKKLNKLGKLSFEIIDQSHPNFRDAFVAVLALEKAGWKGKKGTALASHKNTKNFAEFAFNSSIIAPCTHISLMRLDERIIAGQLNLISQKTAFFIKSAYDEERANFGPGIILYKWVLEQMLDQGAYVELDSCADANHHLEDIWLERKQVQEIVLAPATKTHKRKMKRLILWRRFHQKLKGVFGQHPVQTVGLRR